MRIASLLLAFTIFAGTSSVALAAGSAGKAASKQPSQEKAAKKACLTGEFQKGVGILADLYVETNNPTFIYNQGRCFEQNHRWEDAVDRFLEYIRKSPDLSPADKADVDKHIADCKGHLAEQTPPQPTPVVATSPTPAPVVQPPPPPPPAEVIAPAPPVPPTRDGAGMRVAGLVTGAAGIVALGVGVFCNLKANGLSDDLNTLRQNGGWNQDKESSRKSYETAGWIGYGIGAAAVAAGTTLYILGSVRKTDPTSTVALTPMILPGTAALSMQGTF
jgi:hypothetical protein